MVHRVTIETIRIEISTINKQKYGWSKWGGPMYGMVKSEGEWCCQACGKQQPEGFPQYMLPIVKDAREYVRVCPVCKHIQLLSNLTYTQLCTVVRPKSL